MVGGWRQTGLEGAFRCGLRGHYDVVGGGVTKLFEGALLRDWRGGERRYDWGRVNAVGGGASAWLEGVLRRGCRRRFDVVGR